MILRKRFAKIVGKITHHFQKLHEPARFEDVEFLDKELRNFISELPPHYRMEDADKSLDSAQPYIPIHRYYLSTEILFIVITLHRPWLLRRLRSDRFAMSRRACFDAAKMDFRIVSMMRWARALLTRFSANNSAKSTPVCTIRTLEVNSENS